MYSYEYFMSLSDDEIRNAAQTQSKAIEFGQNLLELREECLNKSDRFHSQGNSSLAYDYSQKQKDLKPIYQRFMDYVKEFQAKGYWG